LLRTAAGKRNRNQHYPVIPAAGRLSSGGLIGAPSAANRAEKLALGSQKDNGFELRHESDSRISTLPFSHTPHECQAVDRKGAGFRRTGAAQRQVGRINPAERCVYWQTARTFCRTAGAADFSAAIHTVDGGGCRSWAPLPAAVAVGRGLDPCELEQFGSEERAQPKRRHGKLCASCAVCSTPLRWPVASGCAAGGANGASSTQPGRENSAFCWSRCGTCSRPAGQRASARRHSPNETPLGAVVPK